MSKSTPKKPNTPTQIEWAPIESVTPYARNPRKIGADAVSAVAGSIKEFGFKSPIIVDKDRVIINGHTRLKAAQQLGLTEVPVVVASDLTPEQVRAYRIADNRSGEFSKWDADLLNVELDDIGDIDLSFCNVDEMLAELAEQSQEEPQEQLTEGDPDAVPAEAQGEPVSQRGEVFELGPHRLMCGDSTRADDWHSLLGDDTIDCVISDPPFPNNSGIMHEMIIEIENSFSIARKNCKGVMFWFWDNLENPNFNEKITSKHIWHKTNGYQAGHFETICCYHGDGERHEQKVFSFANVGGDNLRQDQGNHPTPKPKSLMVSLLDEAKARMVMDPFAGSGSTLIAAAMTGRICRTMEISPRYCDVIRRRWTKFAKENKVNPGTGALE